MRTASDRCPDDLFARSRRSPLSEVERRALEAHLGVCDLCRATQTLAILYDQTPDLPGTEDATLIPRLADRVVGGRFRARPQRRTRPLALAAAAALLVVAGSAAAWVSTHRPPASETGLPTTRPPAMPSRHRAPVAPPREVAAAFAPPPEAAMVPPPEPSASTIPTPSPRRRASAERARAVAIRPLPGAAELFASANTARRARDLRLAVSRYELLQQRFPDSAEAGVSRVSAGDLLARLGNPAAALAQFEDYLRSTPTGPLAPEALFRRAHCLEALARRSEEIDAWRALLRRFPGSIYESVARQRLDELDR